MAVAIIQYKEPLKESELVFLEEKEARERKQYYKVYRILMIMSFVIPFIASWYRAYEGAPNAFSYIKFFVSAGVLFTISSIATYASYRMYHRKLQLDIKDKTKTVETNSIVKKVFIPSKNAYYFYTNSRVKLSIEVTAAYFNNLNEGDEISLEYTTHSRWYLGYF